MPISKGSPYGAPEPVPDHAMLVGTDREARAVLEQARAGGRPYPVIGLLGGDLCRTLGGGRGGALAGVRFPVDVVEVTLEERSLVFVAHLLARSPLWGRAFVAMNGQWLGGWNLGPRAHPNDGLVDTYDVRLPGLQRLTVRDRLASGTHLPHPAIQGRRVAASEVDLGRRLQVRLDGDPVGRASLLSLRVQPDALVVFV